MAYRFQRNYILTVERNDGKILTIKRPFTIAFDITRNTLTSANVCQIQIYNLSRDNQNQLRVNMNDWWNKSRKVELRAGYGSNLPVIFSGNITQAWTVRQGVDMITSIESFDGGFAFVNGTTNSTFPANTTQENVIKK